MNSGKKKRERRLCTRTLVVVLREISSSFVRVYGDRCTNLTILPFYYQLDFSIPRFNESLSFYLSFFQFLHFI